MNMRLNGNAPNLPISPISMGSPITPITPNYAPLGLQQSMTDEAIDIDQSAFTHTNTNTLSILTPSTVEISDDLESAAPITPLFSAQNFLRALSETYEDCALTQNGYEIERKITDTLQGDIYQCIITDAQKVKKIGFEKVAIKRTSKSLYRSGEAEQDGMRVLVQEDIIKEAMVLKYLTKDNKPNGGYIVKFVDFFESDTDYYLVEEYGGDCNLAEFVKKAHCLIEQNKLRLSEYKKVMKFLAWQICSVLYWMHHDMNCCHLDLNMKNICVRNGTFDVNQDGSVSIHPKIALKLCDFGNSEVISPNSDTFNMDKWGLKDSFQTTAPQIFDELVYDGKKSDIWSLGMILYQIGCGQPLYNTPDEQNDEGFYFVVHGKLSWYLEFNELKKFFNMKLLALIENMINVDEEKRFSALQVLKCKWFNAYYTRYHQRIESKSKSQKKRLKQIRDKMQSFPYYYPQN